MRKNPVVIGVLFAAIFLFADSLDVTPTQILSPGSMEFGPFNPSALYKERGGTFTPAILFCKIVMMDAPYNQVYLDSLEHSFEPGSEFSAEFKLADLSPGGYEVDFWAESNTMMRMDISYPHAVDTFGYTDAVNESPSLNLSTLDVSQISQGKTMDAYFSLPKPAYVIIEVYDINGERIASLASGNYDIGDHQTSWTHSETGAGIYFVRLTSMNTSIIRKVITLE